jgi:hypothetical protein
MKIVRYIFFSLVIISFVTIFACNGDKNGPEETEQQKQAKKLEGTWTTTAVVSKPADVPESEVSDLVFSFAIDSDSNPTTFSASGTSAGNYFVTQSTSTWSFAGGSITNVSLSNVNPVTSFTISGEVTTTMTINFTLTTARVAVLDGDYTLTMTK